MGVEERLLSLQNGNVLTKLVETKGKNRDEMVDAIKAFAIICVVIDHCIQYGSGPTVLHEKLYFDDGLFRFICSFHMPLFMLVSGSLFGFSIQKRTSKAILVQRLRTLILPLFSWAIVALGVSSFSLLVREGHVLGLKDLFSELVYTFFHHQWFLWAIFWCSLTVLLNQVLFKGSLPFYALSLGLTFFIPSKHNIGLYCFMYPFFVIGYLYNKEWKEKLKPYVSGILPVVLSWLVFLSLIVLYNRDSYIYTTGFCILKNGKVSLEQLGIDCYRFLVGLSGSLAVICLIKMLYPHCRNHRIRRWISFIGMNTLGIYILSGIIFNDHLLRTLTVSLEGINYGIVLLETIIVIIVSLVLSWVIKNNKLLNLLLLGGR